MLSISSVPGSQTVVNTSTIHPFGSIAISGGNPSDFETVTVTTSNPSDAFNYLGNVTGSGAINPSSGYSMDDTLANDLSALQALVFSAQGQNVSTTFTITVTNDQTPSNTNTATESVIARTGPAVLGAHGGSTSWNQAAVNPFSGVTISDDTGPTITAAVTLSSAGNGTLGNLSSGSYNAGVYTVSGNAGAVTTALRALTFTPNAGTVGNTVTTGFTVNLNDGTLSASDNTTSVEADFGPVITGSATSSTLVSRGTATPFAGITLSDQAGQHETVTVTLSNAANGVLSSTGGGTYNAGTGVWSVSGTFTAVTAALDALVFTAGSVAPGAGTSTTLTIGVTDDANASPQVLPTATIVAIGGPLLSGGVSNPTLAGSATATPFANLGLGDAAGQNETVTVTLSDRTHGALSGGSGSYNAGTGVYTVTGTATQVSTALRSLVFTPTPVAGQSLGTTLTLSVTDTAGLSAGAVASITNLGGPLLSGGFTPTPTLAGTATVSPFYGTISDVAGQTETLTVNLSDPTHGSLSSTGGGSYNAGTGVYTITGNPTVVSTALNGLVFTPVPVPGQSVSTNVFLNVIDTAGLTAGASVALTNLGGPLLSGSVSNPTLAGSTTATPFANLGLGDVAGQSETVTVTLSDRTHGALSSGSGTYNAGTGVYTISGTPSQVTAALNSLVFTTTPVAGQSLGTALTLNVTDTAGLSAGAVASITNLGGPLLSGSVSNSTLAGSATAMPFSTGTISDAAGQSETATVTLSDPTHGALSSTGGGSYNAGTGVYTVTGTTSQVTAALNSLVFTTTPVAGQSLVTTLTLNVTDTAGLSNGAVVNVTNLGGPLLSGSVSNLTLAGTATAMPFSTGTISDVAGQSETATVTLSDRTHGALSSTGGGSYNAGTGVYTVTGTTSQVTAALNNLVFTTTPVAGQSLGTALTLNVTDTAGLSNGAVVNVTNLGGPLLTGSAANPTLAGSATATPFASLGLSDVAGQSETVTVTLSDRTHGALSGGSGSYNAGTGVYTVSGTATQVTAALNSLVFTPTPVAGQSLGTALTLSATDTAGLSAGAVANITNLGGPLLSGSASSPTLAGSATATPFANLGLGDVAGQSETVTVTLSDRTHGALRSGSGSYNAGTGVYTVSGTATQVTAALNSLVFTPTPVAGQSLSTTLTLSATDTAGLTTGTTASITNLGGPVLTGSAANPTLAGSATATPFASLGLGDVAGQSETVTVTLSDRTHGALSGGSGSYNAGTGVYTVTGTAAQVTAALNGLVFTPTPVAGQSLSTTLTLSATDTAGLTTGTTASITNLGGPVLSGGGRTSTTANTALIQPFPSLALADTVGQSETVTVTVSNPSQGVLYNTGNGSYNATTGLYTDTGTAGSVTADLQGLVFAPSDLPPGQTATTTLSVTATDGSGLSTGTTASVTTIGAPIVNGFNTASVMASTATLLPLAGLTITDTTGQTETVTVALSDRTHGTLSHLGNGIYNAGTYTDTGSAAMVMADLQALVFTPAAGTPGQSVATTLTVNVKNGSNLAAYACATTITAVGGPAITGVTASQSIDSTATLMPFGTVTISDDPSQTETVTITVSNGANGANGTLGNLGHGTYTAGTYTDSGSAAAVTADLRALTFTPVLGQSATTSFTLGVRDTLALSAASATTSVMVTAPVAPATNTVPYDFNGSGVSDILFRNNSTGEMGWYIPATASTAAGWTEYGITSADYSAVGVGDFNGDGTADILFRNATTGQMGYYANHPNGPTTWVNLGATGTGWSVLGTGDFNGDGTSDILFRNNTSGDTGVFLLGANGQTSWYGLGPTSLLYSVVGVGRFSGDGKADILFENTATGDAGYYEIGSGSAPGRWIGVGTFSPGYVACGVADLNGDGVSDVLFHNNTTGDLGYVTMPKGGGAMGWVHVGFTSSSYNILSVGNFTGGNAESILFRNPVTGDTGYAAITAGGLGAWHGLGATSTAFTIVASPTFG